MSDFLFSSSVGGDKLSAALSAIHEVDPPAMEEFHGKWGSLAVTKSRYTGFDPVETQDHICVVAGGPVLNFVFDGSDMASGSRLTHAILRRWLSGALRCTEDLSGPFAILIVEKATGTVHCITALMLFVPVFRNCGGSELFLGTHVDALARLSGRREFDEVSLVDFILHGVVTFPHTAYTDIFQCQPATIYRVARGVEGGALVETQVYWTPEETSPFSSLRDAAHELRSGISNYVGSVAENLPQVAHFISGGEDSRVIAGVIPTHIHRKAVIFLDSMNREGRIAQRVAEAYGADFKPYFRSADHYIRMIGPASSLVGSGQQYMHSHSLGFEEQSGLTEVEAVFGGYLSDSLLKASYARKMKGTSRFKFLPEIKRGGEARTSPVVSSFFSPAVLSAVTSRRRKHFARVKSIRPNSAHEWFVLWPMTMREGISNFHSNRRLFASFEPFTSHACVKIAAACPTDWKMNRRLFREAFEPFLRPTRFLRHSDGRFPYFPWWTNSPILLGTTAWRVAAKAAALYRGRNEGPWGDWKKVVKTEYWEELICSSLVNIQNLPELSEAIRKGALNSGGLRPIQQANLLQVSHLAHVHREHPAK